MNADQIRQIRKRLPTELVNQIDRLGITFTARTIILTLLTLHQPRTGRYIQDMFAPEDSEEKVLSSIRTMVDAIERADEKAA